MEKANESEDRIKPIDYHKEIDRFKSERDDLRAENIALTNAVSEREFKLSEANNTIEELRLNQKSDMDAKLASKDR